MKTIDEAARIHCNKSQFESDFKHDYHSEESGFKAGVEFAQRWIPVDEELPAQYQTVLVKDKGGYFFTAHISIHGWVNNERGEYIDSKRRTITHWRQIEIK